MFVPQDTPDDLAYNEGNDDYDNGEDDDNEEEDDNDVGHSVSKAC